MKKLLSLATLLCGVMMYYPCYYGYYTYPAWGWGWGWGCGWCF